MSVKDQIKDRLPEAANKGVEALKSELERQAAKAKEPWQGTIIQIFADATQKLGPTGIALTQAVVEDLLDGKKADISKVTDDLTTASNLLAEMQKAEVRKKRLMRKFVKELAGILLHTLKAVVGLIL